MKVKKVVCGFSNVETQEIERELKESAQKKEIKLELIHRYRKEGILEFVMEHPDFQTVLLQEVLQQSSPYTADDLIRITDDRHVKVIVSLNPNHYGTEYVAKLYSAGIYNAIFEKDAYADTIMALILQGRTRKEARKYYGISGYVDQAEECLPEEATFLQAKKGLFSGWKDKMRLPEYGRPETTKEAVLDLGGGVYPYQGK